MSTNKQDIKDDNDNLTETHCNNNTISTRTTPHHYLTLNLK